MFRLRTIMVFAVALGVSGCDREPICGKALGDKMPSTLPELLKAHDGEIREHGTDICYVKAIGAFGRRGVLASLQYVTSTGRVASSYNNTQLVFGVAEEARVKANYDICKDMPTLSRISEMSKVAGTPDYQRTMQADLLRGLCSPGIE